MNYKVTEMRLREDTNEKYMELTLERIHKNYNLEKAPPAPEPIRMASSRSVSSVDGISILVEDDKLGIVPEPENTEEEMAMNYIKGMRKYAPELFDTTTEIKKFAPPPPTPTIFRTSCVIYMDIEEYAKQKILVGDIIRIEVNKAVIEPEMPSVIEREEEQ